MAISNNKDFCPIADNEADGKTQKEAEIKNKNLLKFTIATFNDCIPKRLQAQRQIVCESLLRYNLDNLLE